MGTDISDEDMDNIIYLCDQVIAIGEYRTQLYDYLKARMNAIAPNLTCMVGELVGARLIAHAGSLLNLAKYPASTGVCVCVKMRARESVFARVPQFSRSARCGLLVACLRALRNPRLLQECTLEASPRIRAH